MSRLGKWPLRPLVSVAWVPSCDSLIAPVTVFGTPILLKCKANKISVDTAPLPSQPPRPHQPSLTPPVTKCPCRNQELISRMRRLLWMGARWMDMLRVAQMAAQEALGVMAVAMLRQQGAMREVSVWKSEVEDVMREMSRLVEEEASDL